jgi:hypothetical protein
MNTRRILPRRVSWWNGTRPSTRQHYPDFHLAVNSTGCPSSLSGRLFSWQPCRQAGNFRLDRFHYPFSIYSWGRFFAGFVGTAVKTFSGKLKLFSVIRHPDPHSQSSHKRKKRLTRISPSEPLSPTTSFVAPNFWFGVT